MKRTLLTVSIPLFYLLIFNSSAESLSSEKKIIREKAYKEQDAKLISFQGIVSQTESAKEFEFLLTDKSNGNKLKISYEHSGLFIFNELLKSSIGKEVRLRGVFDKEANVISKIISVAPAHPIKLIAGENILKYKDADVSKTGLRVGVRGANHFRREGITLTWRLKSEIAASFLLSINQSSAKPGAKYEIFCNNQVFKGTVAGTKRTKYVKKFDCQEFKLIQGENIIQFKILTMSPADNSKAGINLESLVLTQIGGK